MGSESTVVQGEKLHKYGDIGRGKVHSFLHRTFYWVSWFLVMSVLKIFFRVKIEGWKNVPRCGGAILASNHVSAFDPPFVGGCAPRELNYLAKIELFRNPILRLIIREYNAIPLKRYVGDRRALKIVCDALNRDQAVLLFPEGTRSKDGKLGRIKAGVGMISVITGKPIVPVYIEGTKEVWKTLLYFRRLRVKFGPAISPPEKVPDGPERRHYYDMISNEVMQSILSLKNKG